MSDDAEVVYSEDLEVNTGRSNWTGWVFVAFLTYLILIGVSAVGAGFKLASADQAAKLFEFASNPFLGLLVGVMTTALVQSSSSVTTIIVGLVAGGVPVGLAIPMIMGANIGTTITNTLVSLGHIRDNIEFRNAFSAATVHDFFNLLAVIIFLPLEIFFHPLERISGVISHYLLDGDVVSMTPGTNFIKMATSPVVNFLKDTLGFLDNVYAGIGLTIIGIVLIFMSITWLGKRLRHLLVGRAKAILHRAIGRGPLSGITSGSIVTILVQSSSTTTSLMVPLVGSGVFRMRDIYPFSLGANIGTCITALIAATAVSGQYTVFALQIAIVHFLFNVSAVVLIYGLPVLREIPPTLAEKLAAIAVRKKAVALAYIVGIFFLFPAMMIFLVG